MAGRGQRIASYLQARFKSIWGWLLRPDPSDKLGLFFQFLILAATIIIAWSGLQTYQLSGQLADLEQQRESVDLRVLGVERMNETRNWWGIAVANEGMRDTGVVRVEMNHVFQEPPSVGLHSYVIEGATTDYHGRTIEGGNWALIEFSPQANLMGEDDLVGIEFVVVPVLGEEASCWVTGESFEWIRQGVNAGRCGEPVT